MSATMTKTVHPCISRGEEVMASIPGIGCIGAPCGFLIRKLKAPLVRIKGNMDRETLHNRPKRDAGGSVETKAQPNGFISWLRLSPNPDHFFSFQWRVERNRKKIISPDKYLRNFTPDGMRISHRFPIEGATGWRRADNHSSNSIGLFYWRAVIHQPLPKESLPLKTLSSTSSAVEWGIIISLEDARMKLKIHSQRIPLSLNFVTSLWPRGRHSSKWICLFGHQWEDAVENLAVDLSICSAAWAWDDF